MEAPMRELVVELAATGLLTMFGFLLLAVLGSRLQRLLQLGSASDQSSSDWVAARPTSHSSPSNGQSKDL
jgi:hypothetical protein